MGFPFATDLSLLPMALETAATVDVSQLRDFVKKSAGSVIHSVGIGGSYTVARLASLLLEQQGFTSIPQTAFEFAKASHDPLNGSVIIFTASGNNNDVLKAFQLATIREFRAVLVMCASFGSAIANDAKRYWHAEVFEFDPVGRRDGFLATNSLLATCAILSRALDPLSDVKIITHSAAQHATEAAKVIGADERTELIVLSGGFSAPAGVDLESKCSEAALASVMHCDYRHFAHGRHLWLAKRASKSAVIALSTPDEEGIETKTLSLIPASIPIIRLCTEQRHSDGTIELLGQVFHFIAGLGAALKRDPGRPGVPRFGRQLYHLKEKNPLKPDRSLEQVFATAVTRKSAVGGRDANWSKHAQSFLSAMESARFSCIVFDFDGTLCGSRDRYHGVTKRLHKPLTDLLEAGLKVAIATGRGDSCGEALRKFVPKEHWARVRIGYHNGSFVTTLDDDNVPSQPPMDSLSQLVIELESRGANRLCELKPHRYQLTIKPIDGRSATLIDSLTRDIISRQHLPLRLVHSSHSFDVLADEASKLNVVKACQNDPGHTLCIGDRGCWPGNDFELLSTPYSLSVDDVSPDFFTCWNLAPAGVRCEQATLFYLMGMKMTKGLMQFSLKRSLTSLKELSL